jgi:hypothetical protein
MAGSHIWSKLGLGERHTEWLPWYRRKDYDGNLTEAEKRQLDVFRTQPEHPATLSDELPTEVQNYINRIELELYDAKQSEAAGYWLSATVFAIALMAMNYHERFPSSDSYYVAGAALILFSWFWYGRVWKRNAEDFIPSDEAAPNRTDEAIRREWELDYVTSSKQTDSDAA